MSISSELILLNNTKQGIKQAINNKGVTVTSEPFAEYPDKVRLIPNGGGVYESSVILFIEGRLSIVDIPYGTTRIGKYMFANMTDYWPDFPSDGDYYLKSVTIPGTVTEIDDYAFSDCKGLTSITIPSSVTTIGQSVFQHCTGLTSITVEATVPPTLTNNYVFFDTNNCPIYVPDNSVLDYQVAWSVYAERITSINNI